jgi:hypothetical protein
MLIKELLAEGDVIHARFGKSKIDDTLPPEVQAKLGARLTKGGVPAGAKEISMMQAFGSGSENALADAGIKLTEKPDEWSDFDGQGYAAKRNIHEVALKKVEKVLGKLKTWTGKEVFGYDSKPKGPQVSIKMNPKDLGEIAIIKFEDGTRYLVSPTGANTYIRNWQKIA